MRDNLFSIARTASNHIVELKRAGTLQPTAHLFHRCELTNFRYGEKGPAYDQAKWFHSLKEVWWEAVAQGMAAVDTEFKQAIATLSASVREHPRAWLAVRRFFEGIIIRSLEDENYSDAELHAHIDLLERSASEQPILVSVRAELAGVAVLTAPIEIRLQEKSVRLRAITRDDIEEEQPVDFEYASKLRLHRPVSAILEIDYRALNASGWQRELNRAVAVLRLFGVGDVAYTTVQFGSESFAELSNGMVFLDDRSGRPRTYCIHDGDAELLKTFWENIFSALPESFYWEQPEDPVGLAGTHYWYLQAVAGGGWANARVAEVVRALESLFVSRSSHQKISATLRRRASTLLGACGFDPQEIELTLTLAYEVRSRYVHGDHLDKSTEDRMEKQVGDTVVLVRCCLEYLRGALVAAIMAGVDKDALISAIDAARNGKRSELDRIAQAFFRALPARLGSL